MAFIKDKARMCSHSRNWNKPKQKVRFLVAPLLKQSECSAVGSALRSGRRGRAFESPHSDKIKGSFLEYSKLPFISIQSLEQIQDGYVIKHNLLYHEKQDLSLYSSSSFFYVHQLHKNSNYPFRE